MDTKYTGERIPEEQIWNETVEAARAAGREHGVAAGSWVFDGNTDDATLARFLQGIEDGDPAVYDCLPSSPLSGEWADDPTPASVLEDLGVDPEHDGADDLLTAYEDGFHAGALHEAVRCARSVLGLDA